MAGSNATAPDVDTRVLAARITQLGDAVTTLRIVGEVDMAREVELTRAELRRQLTAAGGAPPEPTLTDAVDLLAAVVEALDTPVQAMLVERADWTVATLRAVLNGVQDFEFATSFVRAQTHRLQPKAAPEVSGAE